MSFSRSAALLLFVALSATAVLAYELASIDMLSSRSEAADSSTQHCPVQGAVGPTLPWDYNPLSGKGPEDWHQKNPFCKGERQSPINLPPTRNFEAKVNAPKPTIGSPLMRSVATNMNMAFVCPTPGNCGKTVYKGRAYELVNIHFHAPSEHAMNGRYYPLESHVVHSGGDGTYAVFSIMFDYPPADSYAAQEHSAAHTDVGVNPVIESVLGNVEKELTEFTIPIGQLVKPEEGFCTYNGSLTTPPCTESVTWLMSLHIETVSKRQVHNFSVTAGAGYDGNNRPLQQLHDRGVICYLA